MKIYIIIILIFFYACKKEEPTSVNYEKRIGWVKFNDSYLIDYSYTWDVNIIDKENILMSGNRYNLYKLNENTRTASEKKFNDISVYSNINSKNFYGLYSFKKNVWMVGNTCIYGSMNKGKSWTKIFQDRQTVFTKVFFEDENYGYAVGRDIDGVYDGGVIYKTTNGGICWNKVYELKNNNYTSIFRDVCINNGIVWVIGEKWSSDKRGSDVLVYTSSDIGETWTNNTAATSTFNNPYVNKIQFIGNEGWISGFEEIIYTNNGGESWCAYLISNCSHINDFVFVNPNLGWFVSDNGIFNTTNGGASWTKQLSGDHAFYGIDFIDENFGIASGANGDVYITENGGY